jgi:hypothetical protein
LAMPLVVLVVMHLSMSLVAMQNKEVVRVAA